MDFTFAFFGSGCLGLSNGQARGENEMRMPLPRVFAGLIATGLAFTNTACVRRAAPVGAQSKQSSPSAGDSAPATRPAYRIVAVPSPGFHIELQPKPGSHAPSYDDLNSLLGFDLELVAKAYYLGITDEDLQQEQVNRPTRTMEINGRDGLLRLSIKDGLLAGVQRIDGSKDGEGEPGRR